MRESAHKGRGKTDSTERMGKYNMKESSYKSYDELPLFLNAATVAKVDVSGALCPIGPGHRVPSVPATTFGLTQVSAAPVAALAPLRFEICHGAAGCSLGILCGNLYFTNTSVDFSGGLLLHIMSANILFFSNMEQVEQEVQHLLCKFAACTEDERQIILNTLDCLRGCGL